MKACLCPYDWSDRLDVHVRDFYESDEADLIYTKIVDERRKYKTTYIGGCREWNEPYRRIRLNAYERYSTKYDVCVSESFSTGEPTTETYFYPRYQDLSYFIVLFSFGPTRILRLFHDITGRIVNVPLGNGQTCTFTGATSSEWSYRVLMIDNEQPDTYHVTLYKCTSREEIDR